MYAFYCFFRIVKLNIQNFHFDIRMFRIIRFRYSTFSNICHLKIYYLKESNFQIFEYSKPFPTLLNSKTKYI